MPLTKTFLGVICASTVVTVWSIGNAIFWNWLLPHGGSWRALGAIWTAIVLPGLIVCLFIDLTKRKGP
jgi:hypothetical protein